jgi:hypothetical protein
MHEEEKPASAPSTPETSPETHDVPDWLKDTHETSVTNSTPSWLTEETPATPVEVPVPEMPQPVEKIEDESHADIPDWLKGTETTTPTAETIDTPSAPEESSTVAETVITTPTVEEKTETPIVHEELPDWLKGAETPSEISETKTPEANV